MSRDSMFVVTCPARASMAAGLPRSRTLRAAKGGGLARARPSLTAAAPAAVRARGRDGKTALRPNRKTAVAGFSRRTNHALQKADIFTRHQQGQGDAFS